MSSQSALFEAVLTGDLSLVIQCVAAGCDVNESTEDGYTPLCTAIRNGEVDIACYLISHAQILVQGTPATPASRSAALWRLLWSGKTQHLFANKYVNWVVVSVHAGFSFVMFHLIFNFLLASFDAAVISALHITNASVYLKFRTLLFRGYVASLIYRVFLSKSGRDADALVSGYPGTNLTAQVSVALNLILGYGGNVETIAFRMLAHGLTFNDVNNLRGPGLLLWRWAAFRGHLNIIIALQTMGIDIDIESGVALWVPCYNLDSSLCHHLVTSGAAVGLRPDGEGPPIVKYAAGARDIMQREAQHELDALSIMAALLSNSADINQAGCEGRIALSISCSRSVLEANSNFLLKHGADPNIADEDGNTPLHHAAAVGPPSLVKMLIASGASANYRNNKGKLPANNAAHEGSSIDTLKLLMQASNPTQLDRDTMLFEASSYGFLEMLQYLIDVGANPNTEIEADSCALFKAMDRHWQVQEAMTILLQKARASFATKSGKTALHHLVTGYRSPPSHKMIQLLVERGANLEALREYRNHGPEASDGCLLVTPLWEVCLRHDYDFPVSGVGDTVRVLVDWGANPWIKIESGEVVSCTSTSDRNALRTETSIEAATQAALKYSSPKRPIDIQSFIRSRFKATV
ncbi:MAG: hypothetical protein Q9221_006996 [Calogaya cf. arnoldii]